MRQIRAILELEHPKDIGGVQKLIGKIISLNRFIARSTDRNLPLFKTLRKNENFEWTQECRDALEDLKRYLTKAPLLAKPAEGEPLYPYLAVSLEAINSVLIKIEGNNHCPVYYLSRTLTKPEVKYLEIEKYALCLVSTA